MSFFGLKLTFLNFMSAEYFKIDTNSRAPFQYGICLYLCWGTMIIYGVGASLYTFSGESTGPKWTAQSGWP